MQVKKLYVGNLSYSATAEQIIELFSAYGRVEEANVVNGKGFGFVEFSDAEEAEKAKSELDGSLYSGRNIKVALANPPRPKGEPGSKLYVGNLNYEVSLEQFTKLFEQFGEIYHANLLEGKGYGFVEFATRDMAAAAQEKLDGSEYEGRNLRIDFAGKKKDSGADRRPREHAEDRFNRY